MESNIVGDGRGDFSTPEKLTSVPLDGGTQTFNLQVCGVCCGTGGATGEDGATAESPCHQGPRVFETRG